MYLYFVFKYFLKVFYTEVYVCYMQNKGLLLTYLDVLCNALNDS